MRKAQEVIQQDRQPRILKDSITAPKVARNLLKIALAQKALGEFDQAIENLELAIQEFGPNDEVLRNLGDCLLHQGKVEEATSRYHHALAINDEDSECWIGLGTAEIQKGNSDTAQEYFINAIERNATNDRAIAGLGIACLASEKPDLAQEYFIRALEIAPDNMTALFHIVQLAYTSGEFKEAEIRLKIYLSAVPDDTSMSFALAGVEYKLGKHENALDTINGIIRFDRSFQGGEELRMEIAKKINEEDARSIDIDAITEQASV